MADQVDNSQFTTPEQVLAARPDLSPEMAAAIAADNAALAKQRAGTPGMAAGPLSGGAPVGTSVGGVQTPSVPDATQTPSVPNATQTPSVPNATPTAATAAFAGAPEAAAFVSAAAPGASSAPPSTGAKDPDAGFSEFADMPSTGVQIVGAGAQSVAKGAIDANLETGGALAGGAIGAGIGAFGGPAAPVTVPIGAVIGALGGAYAGWKGSAAIDARVGLKSSEELPEDQRSVAYAGEMLGAGIGAGGAVSAVAKAGLKVGLPVLQNIIDAAKARPIASAALQATSGAVGGTAGMEANDAVPDTASVRVPAEILGSMLSPSGLAMTAAHVASGAAVGAKAFFSSEGQTTLASKMLYNAIKAGKEDPEAIQAALAEPNALGIDMTSAQKTQSPAIAALEKSLVDSSATFGRRIATRTSNAFAAMKNLYSQLTVIGQPAAVSAAAVARSAYYRSMVVGSVNDAHNAAVEAARNISQDAPDAVNQISMAAQGTIDRSLDLVRAAEKELWGAVDKTIPMAADKTLAVQEALQSELPKGVSLPPLIGQVLAPIKAAADTAGMTMGQAATHLPTTTGDMITLRSYMLDAARQASSGANPDFRAARAYGKVADAILEDLNTVGDQLPAGQFKTDFDAARQFTREKNDIFARTYASKATSTTANGADSISPEAYLGRALGSGGVQGDVNMQQLSDATKFMEDHGMNSADATANVQAMTDAQDRIIRLAAAKTIDPTDGRVNLGALSRFARDNANLLNRFPGARDAINHAITSEATAQQVADAYAGNNAFGQSQAALGTLLKTDSPVQAVGDMIAGKTPQTDLQTAINLTKAAPDMGASQRGLQSAVIQGALNKAMDSAGKIDFDKLDAALNGPMQPGLPSPVKMLRDGGIMDPATAGRLTRILSEGQKLANAAPDTVSLAAGSTILGNLLEFVSKVGGTDIGSRVSEAVLGRTSIVAQGYFAKTSRQLLEAGLNKMGQTNALAILHQAIEDPKMMQALMETPQSPHGMMHALSTIQNYAIMAGVKPLMANSHEMTNKASQEPDPDAGFDAFTGEPQPGDAPLPAAPPANVASPAPAPQPHADASPQGLFKSGADALPVVKSLEASADDAVSKPKNPKLPPAIGRYQIQVQTARDHGFPDATEAKLKDPAYNTKVATTILDHLIEEYHGDRDAVLAAYNGGRAAANRWLMHDRDNSQLGEETVKYLAHAQQLASK